MHCSSSRSPVRARSTTQQIILASALILILGACAQKPGAAPGFGPAAPKAEAAEGEFDLEAFMVREVELPALAEIAPDDGFFMARVHAAEAPSITTDEYGDMITLAFGSESEAECYLYRDHVDPAASLVSWVDSALENIAKREFHGVDAGAFGERPYLALSMLYLTDENFVGLLKLYAVEFHQSTLICSHDEVGYTATFRSVVESLAVSYAPAIEEPEWQRTGIYSVQIGDLTAGFASTRVRRDEDGDFEAITQSASLIPRSPVEVAASDDYAQSWEWPDGALINQYLGATEGGSAVMALEITITEDGAYVVEGEFQGKKIESEVTAPDGILGPFAQTRRLIDGAYPVEGPARKLTISSYVPVANPVAAIEVEFAPTGNTTDDAVEYEMQFAGMRGTGLIDRLGIRTFAMDQGGVSIRVQRVHVD